MKHITFYLDFISPYAYLAFEHLPQSLQGLSCSVEYRPLLFAGLLNHHGQLGPAEILPKRDWTYRQVLWLAQSQGVPLQMPASHPFNPLALLRLALACGSSHSVTPPSTAPGTVNRYVCESIFRHVWRGGADAVDASRLQALKDRLPVMRDPASEEIKAELKSNTQQAITLGLFGVPTLAVDEKLFWGLDALPMLRDYLVGGAWFESGNWELAAALPSGVQRRPKA